MRQVHFYGKMPDPFLKEDGSRMTPDEWEINKKQILEKIVDIEYGGMPPKAEYVEYEPMNCITVARWYKVYAGTKEKQISFMLEVHTPELLEQAPADVKWPVMLTGDGCHSNMESDVIAEANRRGFLAVRFNRLEIANDVTGSREGGIHRIYEGRYSDISAWAWGYMVCMDVLEKMPFADETEVGITGQSRGGKTVMLAAAVDERFKYCCPNNSGCHGAVSHRCHVTGQGGDPEHWTETMESMLRRFPTWMGDKLTEYADCIEKLPYDMHYFGAMIAPRYYLQCEGMQDYFINPIGAWQNLAAVKACYRYLGCEDHAAGWFRPGGHRHKLPDFKEFLDFMERVQKGQELSEHLQINPYPEIPLNFDW